MELLLATRSAHKVQEIRTILSGIPRLTVLDLDDIGLEWRDEEEALEPFDTFEENARSKAEYFHTRTGLPTVADDSGLEVDALGGAPGVRSKRFAPVEGLTGHKLDQENNNYLVERLGALELEKRTGQYVCVAALLGFASQMIVTRGEARGLILTEPRGDGGFGYDPYFFEPDLDMTFAELHPDQKNELSHRGKAFRALAIILERMEI
ncbi:MAG TPA: non-canonical purine NTP pyrophosphatase [Gemmatimonadetes bacterium]|nr:non-canonical purine NTP pyrophosphatase [Gemmatimonadota bacterium]